jgi:hypothetical protein
MIDRKAPRSKVNPGVGDVYANPVRPNYHHIVREAANGRIYISWADEKGPLPGLGGVSHPFDLWLEGVERAGMEYFKKGEVPKRNRPLPPVDESLEPWRKKDPEWVDLKKFLGPKEYRRRYTGPEEICCCHWKASWAADEFNALVEAWQAVRDNYYDMVGEYALNGEDSEEYVAAAKRNDDAVKRMEEAHKIWFQAFRLRRVESMVVENIYH